MQPGFDFEINALPATIEITYYKSTSYQSVSCNKFLLSIKNRQFTKLNRCGKFSLSLIAYEDTTALFCWLTEPIKNLLTVHIACCNLNASKELKENRDPMSQDELKKHKC